MPDASGSAHHGPLDNAGSGPACPEARDGELLNSDSVLHSSSRPVSAQPKASAWRPSGPPELPPPGGLSKALAAPSSQQSLGLGEKEERNERGACVSLLWPPTATTVPSPPAARAKKNRGQIMSLGSKPAPHFSQSQS